MKTLVTAFFAVSSLLSFAQTTAPFDVILEPITITGLPGIQSYTAAEYDGKWLIIGGRLDGLHQRQPWQSFDDAGHNRDVYVIDPVNATYHHASISGLSNDTLEAQLSATNANFIMRDSILLVVGGYGLSAESVHITHPMLTAINVPAMMKQIIQQGQISAATTQTMTDSNFAVTGGKLLQLDTTFMLVGGQRFDGQYNPMGHNTYVQAYTNAIRRFGVSGTFPNLSIQHYTAIVDTAELHRRDYNVTYMTDGTTLNLNAWSGVFQYGADLPFLHPVEISTSTASPVSNFSQYLNHYHCPTLSLWEDSAAAMHTVFFGGIAEYYYDANGTLVHDNDVPFVSTIAAVTKQNGTYTERLLNESMPNYLGAGAEFFVREDLGFESANILKMDALTADTTHLGYIYGGINSPGRNVFFGGMTNSSTANATIYKVLMYRNTTVGLEEHHPANKTDLGAQIIPNSRSSSLEIRLSNPQDQATQVSVYTLDGKLLLEHELKAGAQRMFATGITAPVGTYLLQLKSGEKQSEMKFIWH